jgi:hypothetical protein
MLDCWINTGSCLPFCWTYIANVYERAHLYLIGEAEAYWPYILPLGHLLFIRFILVITLHISSAAHLCGTDGIAADNHRKLTGASRTRPISGRRHLIRCGCLINATHMFECLPEGQGSMLTANGDKVGEMSNTRESAGRSRSDKWVRKVT